MDQGGDTWDIVVIGAGMAGASVAAALVAGGEPGRRVLLLEREARPGYHTTGRSAAVYSRSYGPAVIRALTRASAPMFAAMGPPPVLRPRGVLFSIRDGQEAVAAALEAELGAAVASLSAAQARAMMPLLRAEGLHGALYEAEAADIDVDAVHQHYLRAFRAGGGVLRTRAEVVSLGHGPAGWRIGLADGAVVAPVVVNAAGAWADAIAALAGVMPVGLVPKRRTAALVAAPAGMATGLAAGPMVVAVDESHYLKPDAGKLLISPADETPSPPCDAQPEDWDIAVCVDRIQTAFDIDIRRIEHKWAGLRSFVADKCPVAGYAAGAPGFFWLAGQGGYGIQTAPALAQVAAALVRGEAVPAAIAAEGVTEPTLSPARPALAAAASRMSAGLAGVRSGDTG